MGCAASSAVYEVKSPSSVTRRIQVGNGDKERPRGSISVPKASATLPHQLAIPPEHQINGSQSPSGTRVCSKVVAWAPLFLDCTFASEMVAGSRVGQAKRSRPTKKKLEK